VASIDDRWFRDKRDAEGNIVLNGKGKPVQEKTARHGIGRRWLVRWREPDGRERKLSFVKWEHARDKRSEIENDLAKGQYLDPDAGEETFGQYATGWLDRLSVDPLTEEHMRDRFRLHIEGTRLWKTPLRAIRPSSVQAWISGLPAGAAESSKSVHYSYVRAVLNAAVEDELIRKNPCKSSAVKAPKPDDKEIDPWSGERVDALHEVMPDNYRVFVTLGRGLGLRQGELFGLSPDDVDFLRGWVTVRRQVKIVGKRLIFAAPKGGKTRRIPLPSTVRDELAAHLAARPAKEVTLPWGSPTGKEVTVKVAVTNRNGGACQRQVFNARTWKVALGKAGIPTDDRENGMHMLRHVFAATLLDAGESIKAVSRWLGHASVATTAKYYAHLMGASEERTRSVIDQAIGKRSAPTVPQQTAASGLTSV
jgi:integrase